MSVVFCDPFDQALAHEGPGAVFLKDRRGLFRLDANWTRTAWAHAGEVNEVGWRFRLLRDHDTGFVLLLLVTSPALVRNHPRGDVRDFGTLHEAERVRRAFGHPPVCRDPRRWGAVQPENC